jgi:hypothetical protein
MPQLLPKSLLGLVSILALCAPPLLALVPNNEAVIVNSGSTNTIGYRIYVTPAGEVSYVDGRGRGQGKLPANLTRRLFNDINAAMPLSKLQVRQSCVKPVSFGTSTTVQLGAERTSDLSCPGNSKAQKLDNDVNAIAKFLRVTTIPTSQGKPLPPQNF